MQKQSPRGVLKNFAKFTGKHLLQGLVFNKVAGDSGMDVFCEFCEISKNTFFHGTPSVAASIYLDQSEERLLRLSNSERILREYEEPGSKKQKKKETNRGKK